MRGEEERRGKEIRTGNITTAQPNLMNHTESRWVKTPSLQVLFTPYLQAKTLGARKGRLIQIQGSSGEDPLHEQPG